MLKTIQLPYVLDTVAIEEEFDDVTCEITGAPFDVKVEVIYEPGKSGLYLELVSFRETLGGIMAKPATTEGICGEIAVLLRPLYKDYSVRVTGTSEVHGKIAATAHIVHV